MVWGWVRGVTRGAMPVLCSGIVAVAIGGCDAVGVLAMSEGFISLLPELGLVTSIWLLELLWSSSPVVKVIEPWFVNKTNKCDILSLTK